MKGKLQCIHRTNEMDCGCARSMCNYRKEKAGRLGQADKTLCHDAVRQKWEKIPKTKKPEYFSSGYLWSRSTVWYTMYRSLHV